MGQHLITLEFGIKVEELRVLFMVQVFQPFVQITEIHELPPDDPVFAVLLAIDHILSVGFAAFVFLNVGLVDRYLHVL